MNHLNLRLKFGFEINDGSYGTYNTGSQIKFKTLTFRPNL